MSLLNSDWDSQMFEESANDIDDLKNAYPKLNSLFTEGRMRTEIKTIKDKNELVPAFLLLRGLVKQHIDSFNYFINTDLQNIIMAKNNNIVLSDSDPNFYLRYKGIRVGLPTAIEENFATVKLTPHQCRISDLTYSAPITVDLEYAFAGKLYPRNEVFLGRMPIMLGSSNCYLTGKSNKELAEMEECPYDPRGYFVVKGVEKVILIQEQLSKNRIIIEYDTKNETMIANVASSTHETKSRASVMTKNGKIYVKSNSFVELIPIFIIFKAMGIESEQEIVQLIGSEEYMYEHLAICLQDTAQHNIFTQAQALDYLGSKLRLVKLYGTKKTKTNAEEARDILANVFLAHIYCKKFDFYPKCICLALMVRRVLEAIKDPTKMDDKDYYGNKRLECAGQLMSLLFEDLFKKINTELKKELDKQLPKLKSKGADYFDVTKMLNTDSITNGLANALSTGNWTLKRFKMERAGVTQVLNRLSFIACVGMMTRITSQFEKTRKVSGPRALQPSHWGVLCPSDTPDGESCGLVKNLALLTHITTDEPEKPIVRLAINLGMEDIAQMTGTEIHSKGCYMVFLNGQVVGVHKDPQSFVRGFKSLRRRGSIGEFVSIFQDDNRKALNIAADYGRLTRPLIIVENGIPKVKDQHIDQLKRGIRNFNSFIEDGLVEYLDVNEEDNCQIALNEKEIYERTTHLEIDPYTILGCVAGLIPYPHHNQSPRNTYQCAMGKQAIGAIASNQFNRVDTLLILMVYPQTPLVRTKTIELINYHNFPAGHNASVAVMSYSGYDIEDAIVLNKASLDRGFGRLMYMRRYAVELERHPNGAMDGIAMPDEKFSQEKKKKFSSQAHKRFHALDVDGLPLIGEKLNHNDIYVNKVTPLMSSDPRVQRVTDYVASPEVYKNVLPSTVDRVIVTSNKSAPVVLKVVLHQMRRPELGDKLSSRHGQKGVCGYIVSQEDMPFSEMGWCPDLIMNPHGFPSRMTVGKLIELLAGKAACYDGKFKYGTAFAGDKVADVGNILIKNGFSYTGKDCLMSGITGEYLNCYVFSGPIFYQRLKHMVSDKMHARARGPTSNLTRQPTEGRSRDGGLRLGEMERDCLIGYGASNLLLERLMISSDQFQIFVCNKCGMFKHEKFCSICNSHEVFKIKLPYACKLLFQELLAMGIKPKMTLSDI